MFTITVPLVLFEEALRLCLPFAPTMALPAEPDKRVVSISYTDGKLVVACADRYKAAQYAFDVEGPSPAGEVLVPAFDAARLLNGWSAAGHRRGDVLLHAEDEPSSPTEWGHLLLEFPNGDLFNVATRRGVEPTSFAEVSAAITAAQKATPGQPQDLPFDVIEALDSLRFTANLVTPIRMEWKQGLHGGDMFWVSVGGFFQAIFGSDH